jgi:hypothetical protein
MNATLLEETTAEAATGKRPRKVKAEAMPTHDAAALLLEVEAEHAKLTGAKDAAEQHLRVLAARGGTRPEREEATAAFKAATLAIESHLPLVEAAREEARAAEARAQRTEEARTRAEQDAALAEARGRVDAALERADAALAAFEAAGAGVVETVGELTRELAALFAHPKALPWRAEPRTKRLVQAQARLMKAALSTLVDGLGHRAGEATGHPDVQRIRAEAIQGRRRVLEVRGL